MTILVIACHPDDEVIGVGGTILKEVAKGTDVYVQIITKAWEPKWDENTVKEKRREVEKVHSFLGIRKTFFADFLTTKLDSLSESSLVDSITNVMTEVQPNIVYTHNPYEIHKDHKITYSATMAAVRPLPNSKVKKVLLYEIPFVTWKSNSVYNHPNVYENISKYLDKKIEAMSMYKTELRDFPHPRSREGLKIISQYRGLEVGMQAAEAFYLSKELRD